MSIYTVAPEVGGAHVVEKDGAPIPISPVIGAVQAIQAAHNDAQDDDTIRILAGTYDMLKTYADPTVLGPWGSAVYARFLPSGDVTPYGKVLVDRSVTIEGEVDSDNVPTTILQGSANSDAWGFILHNQAHPAIRDLKLEKGYSVVECFTSFDASNLHGDQCVMVIVTMLDDRLCYVDAANSDFTIARPSTITNCRFTNGKQALSVMGGGVTIQNNVFRTMASVGWFPHHGIGPQIFAPATFHAPFLQGKNTRGIRFLDNKLINTDGEQSPNNRFSMFVQAFGGHVVDCEIGRNQCVDLKTVRGLVRAMIGWFGGPASIDGLRVYGNTVAGPTSTGLVRFTGASQGIKNCIVTENILNDVYNANDPHPAVELDFDCRQNQVIDNDYKQSGFPRIVEGDEINCCVRLGDETSDNIVFESGNFPPGQGGAKFHVTDRGANNRVVGQPANEVEDPVGIG